MESPGTGQTLVVVALTPELLELEAIYAPGSKPPPDHLHPSQTERFTVLAGAMRCVVAGQDRVLATGEELVIPPRTPHHMWNDGGVEARVRWETRPALRTAEFLAATVRPETPALGEMARILKRHQAEFQLTAVPPWAQKFLLGFLSKL